MDDSQENARLLDDNFTVTGRSKSRLNEEMLAKMLDSVRLPRYVRDTLEDLENPPEKSEPLLVGVDFGPIESRAVAALVSYDNEGCMTIKHIFPEEFYSGRSADLIITDEFMDIGPVEKLRFEKPIKQNGRDASYLNLDSTKRHGKRRRR